jgi:hypothetical protein
VQAVVRSSRPWAHLLAADASQPSALVNNRLLVHLFAFALQLDALCKLFDSPHPFPLNRILCTTYVLLLVVGFGAAPSIDQLHQDG